MCSSSCRYVLKLEKADVYRLPYLSSGGPGFGLSFISIYEASRLFLFNIHLNRTSTCGWRTLCLTSVMGQTFPLWHCVDVSALLEAARKANFKDISSQIAAGFSSGRYKTMIFPVVWCKSNESVSLRMFQLNVPV